MSGGKGGGGGRQGAISSVGCKGGKEEKLRNVTGEGGEAERGCGWIGPVVCVSAAPPSAPLNVLPPCHPRRGHQHACGLLQCLCGPHLRHALRLAALVPQQGTHARALHAALHAALHVSLHAASPCCLQIGHCPACLQCCRCWLNAAAGAADAVVCVMAGSGAQATQSDVCLLTAPPTAVLQAEEGSVRVGRAFLAAAAAATTPRVSRCCAGNPPPAAFMCSS